MGIYDKFTGQVNDVVKQASNAVEDTYKAIETDAGTRTVTDALDKKDFMLEFFHVPTAAEVSFSGFVVDFLDRYESKWNSVEVFGRMDPIKTFQGTTRVITIDWVIPSVSLAQAKVNLEKATRLFRMLYPVYDNIPTGGGGKASSATSITASPLFKMKYANLIADASSPGGNVETSGLVGVISGFTYTPAFDAGFFSDGDGYLYPQTISLVADFAVLHTHSLGWRDGALSSDFDTLPFPYNSSGRDKALSSIKEDRSGGDTETTYDDTKTSWWSSVITGDDI